MWITWLSSQSFLIAWQWLAWIKLPLHLVSCTLNLKCFYLFFLFIPYIIFLFKEEKRKKTGALVEMCMHACMELRTKDNRAIKKMGARPRIVNWSSYLLLLFKCERFNEIHKGWRAHQYRLQE